MKIFSSRLFYLLFTCAFVFLSAQTFGQEDEDFDNDGVPDWIENKIGGDDFLVTALDNEFPGGPNNNPTYSGNFVMVVNAGRDLSDFDRYYFTVTATDLEGNPLDFTSPNTGNNVYTLTVDPQRLGSAQTVSNYANGFTILEIGLTLTFNSPNNTQSSTSRVGYTFDINAYGVEMGPGTQTLLDDDIYKEFLSSGRRRVAQPVGALANAVLYPNPVVRSFQILTNGSLPGNMSYYISDKWGRKFGDFNELKNATLNSPIDVSDLPAGIYFLHLKTEDEQIVKRIIKK